MHRSNGSLVTPCPPAGRPEGNLAFDLALWREAFMGLDWLALRWSAVFVGTGVPRGDGSAVVLVPGMMASNASLVELAAWLRRMGYRPYYCDITRNVGCPKELAARAVGCIDKAYEETGMRVTLVGHSLGGLVARGAAMLRPDRVSQVVTLGTPVHGGRVHPMVAFAGALARGRDCTPECLTALQEPLVGDVAEASIYSRTDGVVDWQTCRNGARNIEVPGTHFGLVFNPSVYRALGSLLGERRTARVVRRGGAAPVARRRTAETASPRPLTAAA